MPQYRDDVFTKQTGINRFRDNYVHPNEIHDGKVCERILEKVKGLT